jgi:hypothetical protein
VKPGQTLTIEGDYLNLIQRVTFTNNVTVASASFTKWERAKIELVVPREAQTGVIILADTAPIPLELESASELQVVLPKVANVDTLRNKKPSNPITVTGADLDLVETLRLPSGRAVEFTLSDDTTTLSFTLPDNASDGTVVAYPASGVAVSLVAIEVAVPVVTQSTGVTSIVTEAPISLTGTNLELVTNVTFPNVDDPVSPTTQSSTGLTVAAPKGTQSGEMLLNTASGKTVPIEISTLKPVVTAYDPTSVNAGSSVELQGTNLMLVASVTFGGNQTEEVTPINNDKLTVRIPTYAETGKIILTMTNGETVDCSVLNIAKPTFCFIVDVAMLNTDIFSGNTLKAIVQNSTELTDVKINNFSTKYILADDALYVVVPATVVGDATLKLISGSGEAEYAFKSKNLDMKETAIWEEDPLEITWNDGGRVFVPASAFENVTVGSVMKIYFAQKEAWGQAQINNGKWETIPFVELENDGYIKSDIYNDKSVTAQELVLTQDVLNKIVDNVDNGNAIIIQGSDWIITKITLITKVAAAPAEIVVDETPHTVGWSGEGEGGAFRVNKDKFANLQAGNILKFYYNVAGDNPQLKIQDASWAAIAIDDPSYSEQYGVLGVDPNASYYAWTVNAEIVNKIMTVVGYDNDPTALVIAGQSVVVTKITIVK